MMYGARRWLYRCSNESRDKTKCSFIFYVIFVCVFCCALSAPNCKISTTCGIVAAVDGNAEMSSCLYRSLTVIKGSDWKATGLKHHRKEVKPNYCVCGSPVDTQLGVFFSFWLNRRQ